MANADVLRSTDEIVPFSIFDQHRGGDGKARSRAQLIEKKIELLEGMACKQVSNRQSRRWLNDRLLIELVPRLNVDEIRGLFAPPPWGNSAPVSPFCMANSEEWELFMNVDMDIEAHMINSLGNSVTEGKGQADNDKMVALNAWHRVSCRSREALRRSYLSDLVEGYEGRIQDFIRGSGDGDELVLHVQDAFHRLLLHGVCEFYDLISVTVTKAGDAKESKMTKIKKKRSGTHEIPPHITLAGFVKVAKSGGF